MSRSPSLLAYALALVAAACPDAQARPRGPLGIYVPGFFKRVPAAWFVDDARPSAAALSGRFHTVDLSGLPEELTVTVDASGARATVTRTGTTTSTAGAVVERGVRLVSPSLRGRFVLVPYQVVHPRGPDGSGRVELLCRAGLLADGYPQLFQRDEPPRPCPPALAQRVASGALKIRRLLVEGRYAVVRTAAEIRSRPLPGAAIIGSVRAGDDVDVIDRIEGWAMIHGGGVEGFVPRAAVDGN